MANAVVTVLEADGITETDVTVLDVGRQGAAASKSVAASTEDKAVLDAIAASLVTIDGRVDGLETLIASTNTKLDTAITALQIIDNMAIASIAAGDNNIGNVDIVSGTVTTVSTVTAVTEITNDVTVVNDGVFAVQDSAVVTAIEGSVAHGAADSGNESKIGARATTSLAGTTPVDDADRTRLYAGVDGVLITRPYCNLEDAISYVSSSITDGSSTSVIASLGAGIKANITTAIFANDSDTDVIVTLRDGAAGTVMVHVPVPGKTSGVDGAVVQFPVPLRFSAATAVCADPSGATSNKV
jgi:hypothetical protein